jgi:hypothetical protein
MVSVLGVMLSTPVLGLVVVLDHRTPAAAVEVEVEGYTTVLDVRSSPRAPATALGRVIGTETSNIPAQGTDRTVDLGTLTFLMLSCIISTPLSCARIRV